MKPPRIFPVAACAGLLLAMLVAPSRLAYAQDVQQEFPQTVSPTPDVPDSGGVEESPSEAEGASARGLACLAGTVNDTAEGIGDVAFFYDDSHQVIYYSFHWNDQNFAYGPASGSISSKRLRFNGKAGDDCTVTGSGTDDGGLSGKFEFHGECEKFLSGGTFSASVACAIVCAGRCDLKQKKWQADD